MFLDLTFTQIWFMSFWPNVTATNQHWREDIRKISTLFGSQFEKLYMYIGLKAFVITFCVWKNHFVINFNN